MSCHRAIIRLSAVLAVVALVKGCGDGESPTVPPTPEPARATTVTVSPAMAELTALGATVQLTAEVRDQNARVMAGATVTWTSSASSVATVDTSGLVRGVAEGTATITARAGSAQGTAEITVGPNPDRSALVALYKATDGPNWVNNHNWLTDAPLGEWHGVDTDGTGRVVLLNLQGHDDPDTGGNPILFGLHGPIPPELGDLTDLTELYLGKNSLSGPIPPELGNLGKLTRLNLTDNDLSGPIPPELGNLANLTELYLRGNHLSGPIPRELGSLANLTALGLGRNDLTGAVPSELGNLANLTWLIIRQNSLTGPLPVSLLRLDRLTTLAIRWNDGLCVPGDPAFVAWVQGFRADDPFAGPWCNEADLAVLKSLYKATGGTNWTESGGWQGDDAISEWYGVSTDSLGRATALDLTRNGLAGQLPPSLGHLAQMTELKIGNNTLSGRLPLSLAQLNLHEFHYSETELCAPAEESFQAWLNGIPAHEGTGVQCSPASDRDILVALYEATGGSDWTQNENWRTSAPLDDWYGVGTDGDGRVVRLALDSNNLSGSIPPELGNLANLSVLALVGNNLSGPIPSEFGYLANLTDLDLGGNHLSGPIPSELGNLANLRALNLEDNNLSGALPPELGNLANLRVLVLAADNLSGMLPPEIGNLANLRALDLAYNKLSGALPPELGNLANLRALNLGDNKLSGALPPELGNLANLGALNLGENDLSGPVPPEFANLSGLRELGLSHNPALTGSLPTDLTTLRQLYLLAAGGTGLCAPADPGFQSWLEGIQTHRVALCTVEMPPIAYLTQAVQAREFPVPLVADKRALLRVFLTARQVTDAGIPAVRARFYRDGREIHVVDIPGKSTPIPTAVDESSLTNSANAEIPRGVVQPGLEMEIEVDPDGTLDSALGVPKRIPQTGRLAVDVRSMPLFDLTLIPFIWSENQDSSIVSLTEAMAADPLGHDLLWHTRTLLPVGKLKVTAHEPVLSSRNNSVDLLAQTVAIRAMEGGTGYYMGTMSKSVADGLGEAHLPGTASFSIPHGRLLAHELGHNLSLGHAPCGAPSIVDRHFPHPSGSIGAWGYDFRDGGKLVSPGRLDLMSYCAPEWIGDYHFTKALRYRLFEDGPPTAAAAAATTKSLLLWGGVRVDNEPYLEPAFVIEAQPAVPDSAGEYRLTGQSDSGVELFSLAFTMPEVADGDRSSSFAFVLPVRAGWEGSLATITLTGPGGTVSLNGESDRPVAILLNPRSGQVRGILRDQPPPTRAARDAAGAAAEPGLEVLFSRGIPGTAAWQR